MVEKLCEVLKLITHSQRKEKNKANAIKNISDMYTKILDTFHKMYILDIVKNNDIENINRLIRCEYIFNTMKYIYIKPFVLHINQLNDNEVFDEDKIEHILKTDNSLIDRTKKEFIFDDSKFDNIKLEFFLFTCKYIPLEIVNENNGRVPTLFSFISNINASYDFKDITDSYITSFLNYSQNYYEETMKYLNKLMKGIDKYDGEPLIGSDIYTIVSLPPFYTNQLDNLTIITKEFIKNDKQRRLNDKYNRISHDIMMALKLSIKKYIIKHKKKWDKLESNVKTKLGIVINDGDDDNSYKDFKVMDMKGSYYDASGIDEAIRLNRNYHKLDYINRVLYGPSKILFNRLFRIGGLNPYIKKYILNGQDHYIMYVRVYSVDITKKLDSVI